MRSAREQLQVQCGAAVRQQAQRRADQACLAYPGPRAPHDVGFVARAVVEQQVIKFLRLFARRALGQREIFLAGREVRREKGRRLAGLGKDHHAGHVAVETVHREDRARRKQRGHALLPGAVRGGKHAARLAAHDELRIFIEDHVPSLPRLKIRSILLRSVRNCKSCFWGSSASIICGV